VRMGATFTIAPLAKVPTPEVEVGAMVNVGSYIKKGEHGYGSGCLPEWLHVDRRPCSQAMRAV